MKDNRTPVIPGQRVAYYELNEQVARTWLQQLIDAVSVAEAEDGELGDDQPAIDEAWDPRDYDESSTVDQLVYYSQQVEGLMSGPEGDLFFNYEDDSDGGQYRFLVDLDFTATNGDRQTLRLATQSQEARRLGVPDAVGIDAALAVLQEAVSYANYEISTLNTFLSPS